MDLSKGQVYLITLISVLCLLVFYKRTQDDDAGSSVDTQADFQNIKEKSAKMLMKAGREAMVIERGLAEGGPEGAKKAKEKLDDMTKSIAITQPKIVWLPDADILQMDGSKDLDNSLIKYETVEETNTVEAMTILIGSHKDENKVYLGFRPLEGDKAVFFYVDRSAPMKMTDDEKEDYYNKFKNYIIKLDQHTVGFYFMVNILNYEYTSRINMVTDLLKFTPKS